MIVADNDLISYFWIELGRTEKAREVRRCDPDWVAPYLWRSEFRNVLCTYLRDGHLTRSQALASAQRAERDLRGNEYHVETNDVIRLATAANHAAYDCEYVALAEQLNVPLVTVDQRIADTFPDTAVLLEDFGERA